MEEAAIGHLQGGAGMIALHFLFSPILSLIADASIGSNSKTKQNNKTPETKNTYVVVSSKVSVLDRRVSRVESGS